MTHDISHPVSTRWAARTAAEMVFVDVAADQLIQFAGGDLIAIRNDAGDIVAARLIGPVTGEVPGPEPAAWWIDRHLRVDSSGELLSEIALATELAIGTVQGHDWGALGLPDGLESRLRPIDDPAGIDEVTLAHSSSGHRILEGNPLLTMSPGDRVSTDGRTGVVVSIDRRKRTVEIDSDGDTTMYAFDDVQTQEMT